MNRSSYFSYSSFFMLNMLLSSMLFTLSSKINWRGRGDFIISRIKDDKNENCISGFEKKMLFSMNKRKARTNDSSVDILDFFRSWKMMWRFLMKIGAINKRAKYEAELKRRKEWMKKYTKQSLTLSFWSMLSKSELISIVFDSISFE